MKSYKSFNSADEEKLFVEQCEAEFEKKLEEAVSRVCEVEGLKLIALSGPTCSGKTTVASKLIKYLTAKGKNVHVVSIDDFYFDRDVLRARADADPDVEIDYDSEDTIDLEELRRCVEQVVKTDEPTLIPTFDFCEGRRVGYRTVEPNPDDLFIFEGIQAVYPKVTELFRRFKYRSIYVCVESTIDVEGIVFQPNEIRLMRRIVRDNFFRGASPEFTLYLWDSVRANEEISIFPNAAMCDVFVNSAMPFEINLLKPYLEKLLPLVPQDDKHRHVADEILEKIRDISPISPKYLSADSMYYEFISVKEIKDK